MTSFFLNQPLPREKKPFSGGTEQVKSCVVFYFKELINIFYPFSFLSISMPSAIQKFSTQKTGQRSRTLQNFDQMIQQLSGISISFVSKS